MHKKTRDVDNPRDLIDAYLDEIDKKENNAFQGKTSTNFSLSSVLIGKSKLDIFSCKLQFCGQNI